MNQGVFVVVCFQKQKNTKRVMPPPKWSGQDGYYPVPEDLTGKITASAFLAKYGPECVDPLLLINRSATRAAVCVQKQTVKSSVGYKICPCPLAAASTSGGEINWLFRQPDYQRKTVSYTAFANVEKGESPLAALITHAKKEGRQDQRTQHPGVKQLCAGYFDCWGLAD